MAEAERRPRILIVNRRKLRKLGVRCEKKHPI